jgi:hypothetical protein
MRGHVTSNVTEVRKTDGEKQIVWGAVYIPGVPDSHGDFMTADEIEKMAYRFAMKADFTAVDVMHDNVRYGCFIVETFIARPGDPDFPTPGTWVVAVHVPDPKLWGLIKDGTLNGFSMEALAYRENGVELEIEIPSSVTGKTDVVEDHEHDFEVWFDEEGNLVGGVTSEATDSSGKKHRHVIKTSVHTEDAAGHKHRFAYVDNLVAEAA